MLMFGGLGVFERTLYYTAKQFGLNFRIAFDLSVGPTVYFFILSHPSIIINLAEADEEDDDQYDDVE
uniref:Uncharacterized protein n=1 Tax=Timema monikensis TaxID=170555 RepID=A0A7R9E9D0_9NEOP|nr:unnamed protein product [Timema monikensis]